MGVKGGRKQETASNNPLVVNLDFLVLATISEVDLGCRLSIVWFAAFLERVAIATSVSLLQGLLSVALCAFPILHAWRVRIEATARSINHVTVDDIV